MKAWRCVDTSNKKEAAVIMSKETWKDSDASWVRDLPTAKKGTSNRTHLFLQRCAKSSQDVVRILLELYILHRLPAYGFIATILTQLIHTPHFEMPFQSWLRELVQPCLCFAVVIAYRFSWSSPAHGPYLQSQLIQLFQSRRPRKLAGAIVCAGQKREGEQIVWTEVQFLPACMHALPAST